MADGKEVSTYEKMKNAAAGSMTTAKAVLVFHPLKGDVKVESHLSGDTANSNTMKALSENENKPLSGLKDIATDTKENLEKLEGKMKSAANDQDDLGTTESEEQPESTEQPKQQEPDQKQDPYTVFFQFNPASLSIDVDSDDAEPVVNMGATTNSHAGQGQQNSGDEVTHRLINATVTVDFKVVFDALKNQRAFLSDAVNPSPTNVGRQIANLASSKSYTVRPIVEFFLAAIRNIGTRRVDFKWGKMTYTGYLKMADCSYTMFDIKGEPVRAEIDLALSCGDHDICNSEKIWQDRYEKFMSTESALSSFTPSNHQWRSAFVGATGLGKVEKACIRFHKMFLPKKESATTVGTPGMNEDVYVKVHYNPASITMKSGAGETETNQSGSTDSSANDGAQSGAALMKTELSMDLIFDDTENTDAFMLDSGMGSPTGMGRSVRHLKEKMKGREYSVAPISELFVAAAMSSYARQVCFFWNEMEFAGELSKVNVEYTMFNNRGNPIRSKVSIRIRQCGKTAKDNDFENLWKAVSNGSTGKREWAENQEFLEESQNLAQNRGLTTSSGNYIVSNLFRM